MYIKDKKKKKLIQLLDNPYLYCRLTFCSNTMKKLDSIVLPFALIISSMTVCSAQSLAVVNTSAHQNGGADDLMVIKSSVSSERAFAIKNIVAENCEQKREVMDVAIQKYQTGLEATIKKASENEERLMKEDMKDEDAPPSHINGKFDVTMKDKSFDIPSVKTTMKKQDLVYKVPQTTMKRRDIIYDFAGTRMVDKKVGQYPVETCGTRMKNVFGVPTKVPYCTTKWKDIITKVPEFYKEQKKIALDLPEVAMRDMRMSLSVPEVTVSTQRISLKVPEIRLVELNINAQPSSPDEEKIKKEAEAKTAASQQRLASAIGQAQAEGEQTVINPTHDFFACISSSLVAQREAIKNSYDAAVAQMDAAAALLTAQGAGESPEAVSYRHSATELKAQGMEQLKALDAQIIELSRNEEAFIKSIEASII